MNTHVTMAVVAKQAGVHTTTVSLALRNHPSLPLATRKRLQLLADQMGYKRDPALSALVAYRLRSRPRKSNQLLAYLTHWDTRWGWNANPAHRAFFEGASAKASVLGYQLEHFWLGEPGLTDHRMSRILYSRGITGLIVASNWHEHRAPLDFEWQKFSAVKIDYAPRNLLLHAVTNDQRTIMATAMQRAMAAGYRRIGCVMPYWWDASVDLAWSAGFLSEQQKLAEADRLPILYYSRPDPADQLASSSPDVVPREILAHWIRDQQPEVILSNSLFVMPRLDELGLVVPRDIAFVDTFLEGSDGRLAGVHHNCHRVGSLAVEILAGQLHRHDYGIPPITTMTLVEGTWFNGESLPPRQASGPARRLEGLWRNPAEPKSVLPAARARKKASRVESSES